MFNKVTQKEREVLGRYQAWQMYLEQEPKEINKQTTLGECMTCRGCTGCKGCYGGTDLEMICLSCTAPGCKGCSSPGCRGCGSCRA